ncbi:MAG TPA: S8 family serine peptidase, partial [Candidatus Kapabacteria bacterium]|nr:S8 family serine peptidase [Candidatus Kapabacteria bacterium]
RNNPDVEYAQPNYLYHIDATGNSRTKTIENIANSIKQARSKTESFTPNDSAYSSQWNLPIIQAPEGWDIETGDSTILIGFLDTGLDYYHKDFYSPDGRLASIHINPAEDINHDGIFEPWSKDSMHLVNGVMRTGDFDGIDEDGNGFVDDVIGYDFVDESTPNFGDWSGRDADPYDENGHGTATTGIAVAQTNNLIGIAGIAFHCKALVLRAFDATGNGEDKDIAAAIIYAADFAPSDGARVRVINCSFGDVVYSPLMHDAIKYAYDKGIVIVCSSGNNGGTGAHYPSNYPECISVGSTNYEDGIDPSSGGGNSIALVAPGDNVLTTTVNSTYSLETGTSIAAPHVSAAAALLFSHTPTLSPDDVRGILQTSADDIDLNGWDTRAGAGRLNIYRALQSFAGVIKIASPRQDTGVTANTIAITGTAAVPFFSFYQVYIGTGDDPAMWTLLRDTTRRQILNDTLAVWDATGMPDSSYVARLVVYQTNGQTVENRTRFFIERNPPVATRFQIIDAMDHDKHALIIDARSNRITTFSVFFRPKGSGVPYSSKKQVDQQTHNHYVELTADDIPGGVAYELYAEFQNAAGTITRVDSNGVPFTIIRSSEAFPLTNFIQKPYALPAASLFNQTADIYKDNTKDIALLDQTDGGGVLKIYSFGNGKFTARDSFLQQYYPHGFGSTRGDGLQQLLTQSGLRDILFSQSAQNGSPLQSIAFADTASNTQIAVALADVDGDGKDEIIMFSGPQDSVANTYIYKYQSGGYTLMATLPDPNPRAPDGTANFFSTPLAVVGDFDNDGRQDILVGDANANFYIYEYNPTTKGFDLTFQDPNNRQDAYIVAGDFNGDGVEDFVEGFHSSFNWNSDREYDTPYWTFKMFMSTGKGQYKNVWTTHFYPVKPIPPYISGIAAGDLNHKTGDELFINAFPYSYVYTWDAVNQRMVPLQYFPFGISNTAVIADFDGNGINELGFNTGTETDFFEYNATGTPPTPVNFTGAPLDSNVAQISWNAVQGADRYIIYKTKFKLTDTTILLSPVDSTVNTVYTDSTLQSRNYYAYAVAASGASGRSQLSPYITVFPHPKAHVTRVTDESASGISVHFSDLMTTSAVQPSAFSVDNIGIPSSAITHSDSSIALVFPKPIATGTYTLRLHNFRDRYSEPVDTTPTLFNFKQAAQQNDSLYIVQLAVNGPHALTLSFSCNVDSASAAAASNYDLEPTGKVISAMRDSANHTIVHLTLDPTVPVGAFGKSWTVHVTGVTSDCGAIVLGTGSTIGITLFREDLSAMFVYPNPCREDMNDHLTFANLTPQAQITIFTLSGKLVSSVSTQSANGGADWNMRDERGNLIESGIYIYRATGKNSNGNDVDPKIGKFAIVR